MQSNFYDRVMNTDHSQLIKEDLAQKIPQNSSTIGTAYTTDTQSKVSTTPVSSNSSVIDSKQGNIVSDNSTSPKIQPISTPVAEPTGQIGKSLNNQEMPIFSDQDLISANLEIPKTHQNYNDIKKRQVSYNILTSRTPEEISSLMVSGKLIPGSDQSRDLQSFNPELFQKAQLLASGQKAVADINNNQKSIFKQLNTSDKFSLATKKTESQPKPEPTAQTEEFISKELQSRFGENSQKYYDVTSELMSAPNVQRWKDEVYEVSDKVNELDQQIENLYEEAGRELGDEAPDYLRSAYVSTKAKEIRRLRDPLVKELQLAQNMLNIETQQQMKLLDSVTTGIQTDLKEAQIKYQNAFNEQQFEQQNALNQQKFQYQQQQDSLDRDFQQQKYQDSLAGSTSSSSSEPSASATESIVSSQPPSFSAVSSKITSDSVDTRAERVYQIRKLYGSSNGGTSGFASSVASMPDKTKGGQCGAFVNDMLVSIRDSGHFYNTYEEKMSLATEKKPNVGSAVVFKMPGKYAKYGHVGMVVGMDNGYITVKESNFNGDEKIGTRKISVNDPSISGYYTPKNLKKNVSTSQPITSNNTQNSTISSNDSIKDSIIGGTFKIKLNPKDKSYTSIFDPKVLENQGLTGKSPSEVLNHYGKSALSGYTKNPEKLSSVISTMFSGLGKQAKDSSGTFPPLDTLKDGVVLLKSAGVDSDNALKAYTNLLKSSIKKGSEINISSDGSNTQTSFARLMSLYPEIAKNKDLAIKTMQSVMSDDDFGEAFDTSGRDLVGSEYSAFYDDALKEYKKLTK